VTEPHAQAGLGRLLQIDQELSASLEVAPGPLKWLALVLAHSGDSPLWLTGGIVATLWGGPAGQLYGTRAIVATLVAGITASLLKLVFRRARPAPSFAALYLDRIDRHAFPSAHATRAGCVVVTLAPILPAWGVPGMATWAILVCLARVVLQVHYILDVSAGLLLGSLIGLVLLALL
jgi:undecaprenyl-diphosphatase